MGLPYRRDVSLMGLLDFNPNLVLADDFNDVLTWENNGSAGSALAVQNTVVYRGAKSLKATSDTATPGVGDTCAAQKDFLIKPTGKHTLYATVRVDQGASKWMFTCQFSIYLNDVLYSAQFAYTANTETLVYFNSAGTPVEITALVNAIKEAHWWSFSFSFDTSDFTLDKLIINNQIFDLGGVSMTITDPAVNEDYGFITLSTMLLVGAAAEAEMYIDDVAVFKE